METIKSNLRSADAVVNRIEADINIASKEYALSDKIPSVYNIRRRIEFLKSQPQGATRYASEISKAELVLQKAGVIDLPFFLKLLSIIKLLKVLEFAR